MSFVNNFWLTEVKGLRGMRGGIRLTENEFKKATEYKDDYVLSIVANLEDIPNFKIVVNPAKNLEFRRVEVSQKKHFEYQLNTTGLFNSGNQTGYSL